MPAEKDQDKKYLTPIEVLRAPKFIGKIEPSSEQQEFATFPLTINGKPIMIRGTGVVGQEFRASQFNPGKLQLTFDVGGNGEMLFAAEQVRKEIQQALDNECLPELEVSVQSWVKNKNIYLSWPRVRNDYKAIEVNDAVVLHGSEEYERFTRDLAKIGGHDDQVEVGFSLYAWVRYIKSSEGNVATKVTVGMSPMLEYVKYTKV